MLFFRHFYVLAIVAIYSSAELYNLHQFDEPPYEKHLCVIFS